MNAFVGVLSQHLVNILNKQNISNVEVISDDKIKNEILKNSVFAVVKSGTVSLEVCKLNIPSIIIYKGPVNLYGKMA